MKPINFIRINLLLIAAFASKSCQAINNNNNITKSSNSSDNGALILIQEKVNLTDIQTKFTEFKDLFGINLGQQKIDFQMGYGMNSFITFTTLMGLAGIFFFLINLNPFYS